MQLSTPGTAPDLDLWNSPILDQTATQAMGEAGESARTGERARLHEQHRRVELNGSCIQPHANVRVVSVPGRRFPATGESG